MLQHGVQNGDFPSKTTHFFLRKRSVDWSLLCLSQITRQFLKILDKPDPAMGDVMAASPSFGRFKRSDTVCCNNTPLF
jgi:hypothetical protein